MLRCDHIHKSYYLGRTVLPVLRNVSMEVARGELVAIMGASGSGKSTLLHVMSGLDVPQRGQVYYMDQPLFEPEGRRDIPVGRTGDRQAVLRDLASAGPSRRTVETERRASATNDVRLLSGRRDDLRNRSFGFVFQFYHLLPEFDVLENVLLPHMVGRSLGPWWSARGESTRNALGLLDRMGLGQRVRHRPNELSGGERQRVAIARALINQPEVLFADEPTGNLDGPTGRDILHLLKELNASGQTMILVTHDPEVAGQSHRTVRLVDGQVA